MGICIRVLDYWNDEELADIGCNAKEEHLHWLVSFCRARGIEGFKEEGTLLVTVRDIYESLKRWVEFYLSIEDIEGAMRLIWPLQELNRYYVERPGRWVKLVWG